MNRLRVITAALALLGSLLIALPATAALGDAIVPGALRIDPTFEHVGVRWTVSGDADLDSTMTLEFRESGTTGWMPGAPAVRAYPTITVNGSPLGLNYWAASAMFLDHGKTYELRVTITDPDGGSETRTTTAVLPRGQVPSPTRTIYVAPGDGTGTGTIENPIHGLQTAADMAQPGDTFIVTAGTYEPFQIVASGAENFPIAFIGSGHVIIDGNNTDRGVVTIGSYDRNTSHVLMSGLVIQSGHWGIDAQNTRDISIQGNSIRDVDFGVYNRRDKGVEARQEVCNNVIVGRTVWPQSGIPGERGIDLRGTGNVVCNNTVRYFGDCISIQPSSGDSYGNDVYGNDAAFCVDDGIEIDYNQSNVRVWRNRVTSARMGVSVQPIAGGPAYIFRNEFFNLESVPIKMHNDTTGFIVAHNTGVKVGNGHGDNGAMWRNATFRNNVFIGTDYAFEFTTVADEGFRDLDYNAWGTTRSAADGPWFKWDNERYHRIGELPSGVEDHGVEIGILELVGAGLPSNWDVAVAPGVADLRPASGSVAVNAGTPLDNLNDAFTIVDAPDIGAFEYGFALPSYGPTWEGVGDRFLDVPAGHLFYEEIEWLAETAITRGCNPPFNDRYCPDSNVSRGQMAAFLARALNLPEVDESETFVDDDATPFEQDVERIFAAGITRGCNPPTNDRYCPNDEITRGQMAAFLVRALDLPPGPAGTFTDDDGSIFESEIEALAAAGITRGCNPPTNDRYCPDQTVTREQMAAFLFRALAS